MILIGIQARMRSTRLPGKVLREVLGRPLLSYIVERVSQVRRDHKLVVLTTTKTDDDPIVDFCKNNDILYFRGSEDDVLDRYYQASCEYKADIIVRLTSDCPLVDPLIINEMLDIFSVSHYDYLANTSPLPSTFPDGMDVEIFTFKALKKTWDESVRPSDREHVTFYIWNNPKIFKCKKINNKVDLSHYRLTVDYPEDFKLISRIIEASENQSKPMQMSEIIEFLEKNNHLLNYNNDKIRNAGWSSAFEKDRKEGFK